MALREFALPWFVLWLVAAIAPLLISSELLRKVLRVALPIVGACVLIVQASSANPGQRLLASSLLFLYVMKGSVLLTLSREKVRTMTPVGFAAFMTFWPGMRPESFQRSEAKPDQGSIGKLFGSGLAKMYVALATLLCLAIWYPILSPLLAGWAAIFAFLLLVHWGLSSVLTAVFRLCSLPVEKLFDEPQQSKSLREFWTKRWNLPFVEMDRRLFMPFLVRRLGIKPAIFCVFLISGLLHEMALSYPAGSGYGGPMLYFLIQGVLVLVEQRLILRSKLFALAGVLVPLPLLFHEAFRSAFMIPAVARLHELLISHPLAWYVSGLLWVLGVAQLLVLGASFQVPRRLGWREELPKLSKFNQKLMWSYGGFIVLNILVFAIFTFAFHNDLVAGVPAALGFAGFAAAFWILRLGVDFLYYAPQDWPTGATLEVGHALLNSLFLFLALGYSTVVLVHVLH